MSAYLPDQHFAVFSHLPEESPHELLVVEEAGGLFIQHLADILKHLKQTNKQG